MDHGQLRPEDANHASSSSSSAGFMTGSIPDPGIEPAWNRPFGPNPRCSPRSACAHGPESAGFPWPTVSFDLYNTRSMISSRIERKDGPRFTAPRVAGSRLTVKRLGVQVSA